MCPLPLYDIQYHTHPFKAFSITLTLRLNEITHSKVYTPILGFKHPKRGITHKSSFFSKKAEWLIP